MRFLLQATLVLAAACSLFGQMVDYPYQVKNAPAVDARTYYWFFRNGGHASGTLTSSGAGKVISLNKCPAGLASGDYVYIYGGSGTAEGVPITAITCPPFGGGSGTITVTTGQTHSGDWYVGSATSGIQETVNMLPHLARNHVELKDGAVYLHGPVTITSQSVVISGVSLKTTIVSKSNTTLSAFIFGPVAHNSGLENMTLIGVGTQTAGTAIYAPVGSGYHFRNLNIANFYDGITTVNADASDASTAELNNVHLTDIANIGISGGHIVGSDWSVENNGAVTGFAAINLGFSDGLTISNVRLGGKFTRALSISPPAGTHVWNGLFSNLQIDTFPEYGIFMSGIGNISMLNFANTHIETQVPGAPAKSAVYINHALAENISFNGGRIAENQKDGVEIVAGRKIQFANMLFANNGRATPGTYSAIKVADVYHLSVNNNRFAMLFDITSDTPSQRHALVNTGAIVNLNFTGNMIDKNTLASTCGGGGSPCEPLSLTNLTGDIVIEGNSGIESRIGTVASASSIALDHNYNTFALTGTTGVNTITGLYEGRTVQIITTSGAVSFSAGATIGNSVTSTLDVPLFGVVKGGKLHLDSGGSGGGGSFSGEATSITTSTIASLPPTCFPGEVRFVTDATVSTGGFYLNFCRAVNTWEQFGYVVGGSGALTSNCTTQPCVIDVTSAVPLKAGTNAWTGSNVSSGASKTAPFRIGAADPGTCDATVREFFFNTTSNGLKVCNTANVWTLVGGGSGTLQAQLDGVDVGSPRGTVNFITGDNSIASVVDTGTKYNVTITPSPLPSKVWLPAAGCQNTTASLMWDTPTASPAVAACITGTNTQKGVADFADAASLSMQTTLYLPSDFTLTGGVDVRFKWLTSATSGDVVWQLAAICVADAETDDPAFNTASTVTDTAKGTTLQTNDATITGLTVTGCLAGELMHVKVLRDAAHASDSLAAAARLIGVELTLRRTQ